MTAIANHPHRVTSAIAEARTSIGSVADTPVWSMDTSETTSTLQELKALAAQVTELQTRMLSHADRVELAADGSATSTANWYAVTTQTTRPQAHRLMRIAQGLEAHEATRAALAEGEVLIEQAEVILRSLSELPQDLDPEITEKAEQHLLQLARTMTPRPSVTWVGASSRWFPPRPPTPKRPSSSTEKNAPQRPRLG